MENLSGSTYRAYGFNQGESLLSLRGFLKSQLLRCTSGNGFSK